MADSSSFARMTSSSRRSVRVPPISWKYDSSGRRSRPGSSSSAATARAAPVVVRAALPPASWLGCCCASSCFTEFSFDCPGATPAHSFGYRPGESGFIRAALARGFEYTDPSFSGRITVSPIRHEPNPRGGCSVRRLQTVVCSGGHQTLPDFEGFDLQISRPFSSNFPLPDDFLCNFDGTSLPHIVNLGDYHYTLVDLYRRAESAGPKVVSLFRGRENTSLWQIVVARWLLPSLPSSRLVGGRPSWDDCARDPFSAEPTASRGVPNVVSCPS